MKQKDGFTYVEMVVVLAVTILLAALIFPKLNAMRAGRDERGFRAGMRDLALRARSRAIETGDIVTLTYDKAKNELRAIEQMPNGSEQPIQTLTPPASITPLKFDADKYASDTDTWTVPFYADGTTAGGGVEFDAIGRHLSFVIMPGNGQTRMIDGPMPDLSRDRWRAGTYERRT